MAGPTHPNDRTAEIKRQRLLVMLATALGIGAAVGIAIGASPGSPLPAGAYIIAWGLASAVALTAVYFVSARAIHALGQLEHVEALSMLSDQPENVDLLIGRLSEIARTTLGLDLIAYTPSESAGGTGTLRWTTSAHLGSEHLRALQDAIDRATAQDGEPLHVTSLLSDEMSTLARDALAAMGSEALLVVPLVWGAVSFGLVCFAGPRDAAASPAQLRFLSVLGRQIAGALSSSYLQRRQQAVAKEVAAYREMASRLAEAESVPHALPAIASLLSENLDADAAGIIIRTPGTGDIVAMAGAGEMAYWSEDGPERLRDATVMAQVGLTEEESVRLGPGSAGGESPLAEMVSRLGMSALIAAPVRFSQRDCGVIVCMSRNGEAFSAEDESRLKSLAAHLGTAVENARLYSVARERADHLEKLAEFKRSLIYSLTHEIRASLSALKAATDMLLEEDNLEPDSETYFRLLQSISRNVARQQELVSNLADMASLEDATLRLKLEEINVVDLVAEATTIVAPMMDQRGQVLSMSIPPDLPALTGDRQRLSQALTNLLTNAAKYTPEGSEVLVSVHQQGGEMVFTVSDSGMGVSPEERERIFEAFYRAPQNGEAGIPGSGLGLAIARSLIELHRGSIWVEDSLGGGASFVFSVPVEGPNERPGH